VVQQAALIEDKYIARQAVKQRFSVSTQHYSFTSSAFVELVRAQGGGAYEFILREGKTYDTINDVKSLRSEMGVIYLCSFNEAVISKNIVAVLTEFLVFETPGEENPENSMRIEETLSFINENLDQPITLDMLAQRASLSSFYFSRVFKKETGYAPREYLIHTRMNAARFYLRTTNLSLKEITYRCGYGSESTFCTMFKRITGMTPLEYRNQQ